MGVVLLEVCAWVHAFCISPAVLNQKYERKLSRPFNLYQSILLVALEKRDITFVWEGLERPGGSKRALMYLAKTAYYLSRTTLAKVATSADGQKNFPRNVWEVLAERFCTLNKQRAKARTGCLVWPEAWTTKDSLCAFLRADPRFLTSPRVIQALGEKSFCFFTDDVMDLIIQQAEVLYNGDDGHTRVQDDHMQLLRVLVSRHYPDHPRRSVLVKSLHSWPIYAGIDVAWRLRLLPEEVAYFDARINPEWEVKWSKFEDVYLEMLSVFFSTWEGMLTYPSIYNAEKDSFSIRGAIAREFSLTELEVEWVLRDGKIRLCTVAALTKEVQEMRVYFQEHPKVKDAFDVLILELEDTPVQEVFALAKAL